MPPLDALYTDLTNLGKLFGVEKRAAALIAGFKKEIAAVHAQAPAKKPTVFLYDSGQDQPFTAGRYAAPEQVITEAGGVDVMQDVEDSWTTVGWESVVRRNPDTIVICDYGDLGAEQKKKFLLSCARCATSPRSGPDQPTQGTTPRNLPAPGFFVMCDAPTRLLMCTTPSRARKGGDTAFAAFASLDTSLYPALTFGRIHERCPICRTKVGLPGPLPDVPASAPRRETRMSLS
jgi:hypothetical protein